MNDGLIYSNFIFELSEFGVLRRKTAAYRICIRYIFQLDTVTAYNFCKAPE